MTLNALQSLARRAMRGVPHANADETIRLLAALSDTQREQAARIYASLIGEPSVPVRITQQRSGSPARDVLIRRAMARREIENRRDARAI